MRIVEKYCAMQLTYDSDRMKALDSVAKQLGATQLVGAYCAGMWRKELAKQIPWKLESVWRRPDVAMAPTWSWASTKGEVTSFDRGDVGLTASRTSVEILDVSGTAQGGGPDGSDVSPLVMTIRRTASKTTAEVIKTASNPPAKLRTVFDKAAIDFYPDIIDPAETIGLKIELCVAVGSHVKCFSCVLGAPTQAAI